MTQNIDKRKNIKTALICGVAGQDGSYLASLLLSKNYIVYGTTRDVKSIDKSKLKALDIANKIKYIKMDPEDSICVFNAINNSKPDEIYYLSGQSSVALSFEFPTKAISGTVIGTINVLEACKKIGRDIRMFFAGSGECFGETLLEPADETTPFDPLSPYAVAKASSYNLVKNYRRAYGLYACTGILFSHESPLRSERFVTQKIIQVARRIARGENEKLTIGSLEIVRDWGWAPEYVEAMWRMLQIKNPVDLVIATGVPLAVGEFASHAFKYFNLDFRDYIKLEKSYYRPLDVKRSVGNSSKAFEVIGWAPTIKSAEVVRKMLALEH